MRLRPDPSAGMIQVLTPLWGGPAYKAGLRTGDVIVQIEMCAEKPDGEPLEPPAGPVHQGAFLPPRRRNS